jgi:hypothetical protein
MSYKTDYTVIINANPEAETEEYTGLGKHEAISIARREAENASEETTIFISRVLTHDGQMQYLNSDGNYSPIGENWV